MSENLIITLHKMTSNIKLIKIWHCEIVRELSALHWEGALCCFYWGCTKAVLRLLRCSSCSLLSLIDDCFDNSPEHIHNVLNFVFLLSFLSIKCIAIFIHKNFAWLWEVWKNNHKIMVLKVILSLPSCTAQTFYIPGWNQVSEWSLFNSYLIE